MAPRKWRSTKPRADRVPPQRQVPHLRGPWINFDQVRVSSVRLQHEIKSVNPRKTEPADHLLGGRRHLRVFDQAQNTGGTRCTALIDHLEMQTGQYCALPARDWCWWPRAPPQTPAHSRPIDGAAAKARPNSCPGQPAPVWRPVPKAEGPGGRESAFSFFDRMRHPHTLASRGAICLQHRWKAKARDPFLEVVQVRDDLGFRSADSHFPSQIGECGSRIDHGEAFWRTQRALDQFADPLSCFSV